MCKWNYLIFLIFLVPPGQAQEENPSKKEKQDLSTKLFREINDYLSQLILNHKDIMANNSECSDTNRGDIDGIENRDYTSAPLVRDKFKQLQKHLLSQDLVNECPDMEDNIKEYKNALRAAYKTNMTDNLP